MGAQDTIYTQAGFCSFTMASPHEILGVEANAFRIEEALEHVRKMRQNKQQLCQDFKDQKNGTKERHTKEQWRSIEKAYARSLKELELLAKQERHLEIVCRFKQ